jgi:hypothetical protein
MELIKILYYLLLPFILIYSFVRVIKDRNATFEEYLRPELKKMGFDYKFSKKPPSNSCLEIEKIPAMARFEKRRLGLGVMAAGLATISDTTFKIVREVGFEDEDGNEYKVLVAIEFSDFLIRKYLGVSWHPDMKSLKNNKLQSLSF